MTNSEYLEELRIEARLFDDTLWIRHILLDLEQDEVISRQERIRLVVSLIWQNIEGAQNAAI